MKPVYAHFVGGIALTFAIAACVPAPDSTPRPTPTPTPVATTPAPAPAPTPHHESWMDAPRTPGDWSYQAMTAGSLATYGDSRTTALFSIRCDRGRNSVVLSRAGQPKGTVPMRIRTETGDRTLSAQPMSGDQASVGASLAANDQLLDAMALSKGRFAVETQGMATLYVPTWGEVTRVIEDCR